jgi:hypothetical protein
VPVLILTQLKLLFQTQTKETHKMTLKTLIVSSTLALSSIASAQWGGSSSGYGVNVGFGGSYNRTNISTPRGNTTITNTQLGGGINVGFGGNSYGGIGPAPLPYYGGMPCPAPMPCYPAPVYPAYVSSPVYVAGPYVVYPAAAGGQWCVR